MKRFIPFLRQLREYAEADPVLKKQAEDLLAARNAIYKKKEDFIEKEKQQYKNVQRTPEQEEKFYAELEKMENEYYEADDKYQQADLKAYPEGSAQRKERRDQRFVDPIMRRAIERARSSPSREVYAFDPKDPTNEKGILLGKLGDDESDTDFDRRIYQETRKSRDPKTGFYNDPRLAAYSGNYTDDANTQEYQDQMLDFTRNLDPRIYDQRIGFSRANRESGRREQEQYEKRLSKWWDEGGPSQNKSFASWKDDAIRLSGERRKKEREMEQQYYNMELSMAGEVGDKRPKTNPYINPTEKLMTAMRHAKIQAWNASNNAQDIQRQREQAQKEREQESERIRKENEKRAEERRKEQEQKRREQERSKPIARPEAGRAEPA